jgi:hypothetical protein
MFSADEIHFFIIFNLYVVESMDMKTTDSGANAMCY